MKMEFVLRKIIRIFDNCMIGFFLLLFLIGIYMMVDTNRVYESVAPETFEEQKPEVISEGELKKISGDTVAWISIDDTTIDYPVLQGRDNMEYLSKDAEGNYSVAGSIFLDCENSADFSDPYNILYGHHMAQGLMFGALDAFAEKKYFEQHRTGTLSTGTQTITLRIVAFLEVPAGCEEIFRADRLFDREAFFAEQAIFYHPEEMTGRLIALTTCKEPSVTERTVLIAAMEG